MSCVCPSDTLDREPMPPLLSHPPVGAAGAGAGAGAGSAGVVGFVELVCPSLPSLLDEQPVDDPSEVMMRVTVAPEETHAAVWMNWRREIMPAASATSAPRSAHAKAPR